LIGGAEISRPIAGRARRNPILAVMIVQPLT
jgi:hypothetical protein